MEKSEAKSTAKAIYLQAAALAGFEVRPDSPERLADIVEQGYANVDAKRRPEAAANALRLIALTLELAQTRGDTILSEKNVAEAQKKLCPVYPFGGG